MSDDEGPTFFRLHVKVIDKAKRPAACCLLRPPPSALAAGLTPDILTYSLLTREDQRWPDFHRTWRLNVLDDRSCKPPNPFVDGNVQRPPPLPGSQALRALSGRLRHLAFTGLGIHPVTVCGLSRQALALCLGSMCPRARGGYVLFDDAQVSPAFPPQ